MTERQTFVLCLALIVALAAIAIVPTALYWQYQFDLKKDGVVAVWEPSKIVYHRIDGKPIESVTR